MLIYKIPKDDSLHETSEITFILQKMDITVFGGIFYKVDKIDSSQKISILWIFQKSG